MSLQSLLDKIPANYRYEAMSILHTFVAGMGLELVARLSSGNLGIPSGKEALLALGLAVGRSGIKAVSNLLMAKLRPINEV